MATIPNARGLKRAGSLKEEPVSKRPRLETVTRVFAADNNQSRSAMNRKGVRNKNVTMRDLLIQSRNAMLGPRLTGSRTVSRMNGSKAYVSRPHGRSTSAQDIITVMEVDQDNPSRPFGSHLSTSKTLDHGAEDVGLAPSLNSVIGEPSRDQTTGIDNLKITRRSQEQGSPCFSINAAAVDRRSRPPKAIRATSFHTPHSTSSLESFTNPRQPTVALSDQGMGPASRASSHCRSTFVSLSGANKRGNTRPRESTGSPGMPTWLVQTLSGVSPRYSLAAYHSNSPFTPPVDLESPNEGSQLLSFHPSTPSVEHEDAKPSERRSHPTSKPSSNPQLPEKDVDAVFAFLPPPASPQMNSRLSLLGINPIQHEYATSTPPGYASSIKFPTRNKAKDPKVQAPNYENPELSLFDTSISPIAFHEPADATELPHSLYSHFTVSPPGSADTLLSDSGFGDMVVKRRDAIEGTNANENPRSSGALSIDTSPTDPFGATWASLQRSKPSKPFTQRRFFFSSSQYIKPNGQLTLPSHSHSPKKATLSPDLSSGLLERDWAPSFPNAKYPNHRHAPPPQKSQLRNNFLGAETPLVTLAAIEEATTAADNTSASHQTLDALKAANCSIHVRFHTPLSSSVVYSERPASALTEDFDPALQLDHPSDGIGNELPNPTDDIHFLYDKPFKPDSRTLLVDAMLVESQSGGLHAARYYPVDEIPEEITSHREFGVTSAHQTAPRNSLANIAGIEREEDLCQSPETNICEEMEKDDAEQPLHGEGEGYYTAEYEDQLDETQNDHSSDPTRFWE